MSAVQAIVARVAGRQRLGTWLGAGILLLVAVAWLTSLVANYDVVADVDPTRAGLGPGAAHWLGTDHLGRDVFWRMLTASEAFVGPGLSAGLVAVLIGVPAGATAGYLGGPVSHALRYGFSVVGSLPRFVLVLLFASIYGDAPTVLALATGLSYVPALGEALHGRIEQLREAEFVAAARAHGVAPLSIIGWHLLWVNCRRMVGRHVLHLFGYYLLVETTLSYIGGFGVEEPNPSWGNMLAFEFGVHGGNLWAWLAPALAIWLVILGTALTADGLAEPGHASC